MRARLHRSGRSTATPGTASRLGSVGLTLRTAGRQIVARGQVAARGAKGSKAIPRRPASPPRLANLGTTQKKLPTAAGSDAHYHGRRVGRTATERSPLVLVPKRS